MDSFELLTSKPSGSQELQPREGSCRARLKSVCLPEEELNDRQFSAATCREISRGWATEVNQLTVQPEEKVSVVILFPFLLEVENSGAQGNWSFPLPLSTRSHHKGSLRNSFPRIWLMRRTTVRNTFDFETNKMIPKRQGLETNVSKLKSGKDRNEALLPVLTMMGKSQFSKSGKNLHSL